MQIHADPLSLRYFLTLSYFSAMNCQNPKAEKDLHFSKTHVSKEQSKDIQIMQIINA